MKYIYRAALVALAILYVASCAQTKIATVNQPSAIKNARSVYVVKHENSNRDIEVFLKDSFRSKGLDSKIGQLSSKPASSDLSVTFVDRWHWDMVMYLRTLDVSIVDNKSSKEIATAIYRNSALHGFPDPRATCQDLINLIYAKVN